ncbi:hypothetical protein [Stenotrophomonas tumulicola]|uniref:Uncharacterized protein n=1 Tax=Stenotrophomonas tumulicola TaxID=1685415 RepID=A0A7W3FQT8_9GAMM|nr:hypothetical protein [Stenotrophomonas tumulicola]MBA8683927.1 hypothetical protein [Stenotrophomonas tumulicola]
MIKANEGKARCARAKAAGLMQEARELDQAQGGDWRARARRRRGADRLRADAMRFERLAVSYDPDWEDYAA